MCVPGACCRGDRGWMATSQIDRALDRWFGRSRPEAWRWTRPILARQPPNACPACGVGVPEDIDGHVRCSGPPPGCVGVTRLGPYEEDLAQCVRGLKFNCWWELAAPLGDRLGRMLRAECGCDWAMHAVVVPMPMPVIRRYRRGLDHADLLSRSVARCCRASRERPLWRWRGSPQAGRSRRDRLRATPAGWMTHPVAMKRLAGRDVILVDDVLTTGRSASIAAGMLKARGVPRVWLAVVSVVERGIDFGAEIGH